MITKKLFSLEESFDAHNDLIGATLEEVRLSEDSDRPAKLTFAKGVRTINNVYHGGIGASFDTALFLNQRVSAVQRLPDRVRVVFENGASFDNGDF